MRTVLGYGLLALGLVIAALRLQPPAPLPANAAAVQFSAERALVDIRAIAQRPHPVGTVEHDRVRDYLADRLSKLGLSPSLRPGRGTATPVGAIITAPVTNIAGIMPGKDRSKPALLVMAHYDSVPNSPGAADDGAGVGAVLEIARALSAGPKPERDVIFLLTDGEELYLLGATAFFESDPLARRVGAVINFDARGDSGLASMFETGPKNGAAIAAYAKAVSRPSADSLARLIYRLMPNGTDFTLALQRNLPGFNFAFIGDEAAYHSPLATPDHLNLASVQHMGEQALASAQVFANNPPPETSDGVYSDVLGLFMIQYSFAVGWVLFALAAVLALFAVWRAHGETQMGWGRGIAGSLLLFVFPTQLLWAAGRVLALQDHFRNLSHFEFLLAGAAAFVVGAAALVVYAVERGRGRLVLIGVSLAVLIANQLAGLDLIGACLAVPVVVLAFLAVRESRQPAALWPATLLLLLILSLAAQLFAAEGAFAFVWPLLIAAAVAALRVVLPRGAWQGGILAMIAAVLVTAFAAYFAHGLFVAVGVDMPIVLLMPLIMIMPALLLVPGMKRAPLAFHGAILLAGVALFAYGRWAPASETRPQISAVRYVYDVAHAKGYHVAYYAPLDDWENAALKSSGGEPRFAALPWDNGQKLWWSPAKPAGVPSSGLDIRREAQRVVVRAAAGPQAYSMVVQVRPDKPIATVWLNGVAQTVHFRENSWNEIRIYMPGAQTIDIRFDQPAHGKVEARLLTTYLSWPASAAPLLPMPNNRMAFGTSGGTQTVLARALRW